MDIQRQCVWCGRTYIAHGFGSRYCSSSCKNKAKRSKEKEEKSRFDAVAPKLPEVKMVTEKEYLTARDVAALFGISLATVYRYAAKGVFKAYKLNGVKLIVRKSDLEYIFDHAAPYKKRQYGRQENKEYYTMKEIMEKFYISRKAAMNRIKRNNIQKVHDGRNTFFPKKAVDEYFGELIQSIRLDDYYTPEQMMDKFQMSKQSVLSFVTWHKIPRKKILQKVYYSKVEVDKLKNPTKGDDAAWYTYAQLMETFGLTKDQISYKIHTYHLKTIRMGKLTLISKMEFNALMNAKAPSNIYVESSDETTIKELEKRREKERRARLLAKIPAGYMSIEQIAEKYALTIKHVQKLTRNMNIKEKKKIGGYNYFPSEIIEKAFAGYEASPWVKLWISAKDMEEQYLMTPEARRSFAYRHKIPTKIVKGKVFYSKEDIDKVKSEDFDGRDKYYSVGEIMKKYGVTKWTVYNKVKYYKVKKVHKSQFSYFNKEDIERIFGGNR